MPFAKKIKYIAVSSILIILSVISVRSSLNILKNKKRLENVISEVNKLEEQKKVLEKSIDYKKSREYIEERARNDLNLIKPGEEVYVIVGNADNEDKNNVLSESDEREEAGIKDSNPYMWYKLFF